MGIYLLTFLIGYFIFSHENNIRILNKFSFILIPISLILGIIYSYHYFGKDYASKPVVNNLFSVVYSWFACLSILGGVNKWMNYTNDFFNLMTRKSYGLYTFHYLGLTISAYSLK